MNTVIDWTEQSTVPIVAVDPQHPQQMPRNPTPPKFTCALGVPLLTQGKVLSRSSCRSYLLSTNILLELDRYLTFVLALFQVLTYLIQYQHNNV